MTHRSITLDEPHASIHMDSSPKHYPGRALMYVTQGTASMFVTFDRAELRELLRAIDCTAADLSVTDELQGELSRSEDRIAEAA